MKQPRHSTFTSQKHLKDNPKRKTFQNGQLEKDFLYRNKLHIQPRFMELVAVPLKSACICLLSRLTLRKLEEKRQTEGALIKRF